MKEAYMREGVDHIDDPLIMNIARICAGCASPYPSPGCAGCAFNPTHYTEPKRAMLMRANAMIRYDDSWLRADQRATHQSIIICLIVLLVFILSVPILGSIMSKGARTLSSWDHELNSALERTRSNLYDVSQDGLINCQDYAILFRRYFLGAKIVYNPAIGPTGHLFNSIVVGGKIVYIEPQAPEGKWRMEDAWSEWNQVKYLCVDVTSSWMR